MYERPFYYILALFLLCVCTFSMAQTGSVGIGTPNPNINSVLHLHSENTTPKGFLLPRLDQTQFTDLSLDENGMLIYDTKLNQFFFWKHPEWVALATTPQVNAVWISGEGLPTDNLGEEHSYYLDTKTRKLYQKSNGTYQFLADLGDAGYWNTKSPGTIYTANKVGIGVENPTQSLMVKGNVVLEDLKNAPLLGTDASGTLIAVPNGTGILTNNGSGLLSWQPLVVYTPSTGINIVNGVISNTGDTNAGDDITDTTPASGDVSGKFSATKVVGLQGRNVADVTPASGDVLTWDGTLSKWAPKTPSGGPLLETISYTTPQVRYYSIDPIEFVETGTSNLKLSYPTPQGIYVEPGNGKTTMAAPIHLPDNAVVTGITVICSDVDATDNITAMFVRTVPFFQTTFPPVATNAYTQIGTTATSTGASASLQSITIPVSGPTATIDNLNFSYKIVVFTEHNTNHKVYGVRIAYTVSKPD